MLWFERVAAGVLVTNPDPAVRSSVEGFVDGTLRDMPEPIRAGVAVESLLLGAYAAALRSAGRLDDDQLRHRLDAWERGPIGPVRQWVRMMRSLVLFAENELAEPAGTGAGAR